mmetsp:Transcript_59453/g.118127  ORF Transcript_59453/g.118127 Transcript_59453/m.118127 type:complete len:216 (+) Transcript_59453:456-1103(+)
MNLDHLPSLRRRCPLPTVSVSMPQSQSRLKASPRGRSPPPRRHRPSWSSHSHPCTLPSSPSPIGRWSSRPSTRRASSSPPNQAKGKRARSASTSTMFPSATWSSGSPRRPSSPAIKALRLVRSTMRPSTLRTSLVWRQSWPREARAARPSSSRSLRASSRRCSSSRSSSPTSQARWARQRSTLLWTKSTVSTQSPRRRRRRWVGCISFTPCALPA